MAFGFDDFSKFFDPISDVLGTSGRQGVGLLQQKPEDIAMAAAAAYLAANGIPVSPETLAAAEPLAAAGPSAALTTDVAAMVPSQVAAMTPEASGIMEAAQMDPALMESINAPGIKTAGLGSDIQDYLVKNKYLVEGVDLNPPDYRALSTEQLFAQDAAKASLDKVPQDLINADRVGHGAEYLGNSYPGTGMGPQINTAYNPNEVLRSGYGAEYQSNAYPGIGHGAEYQSNAYPGIGHGLEDKFYEGSPESEAFKKDFNERLAFRSAEMPGSNIKQFDNPASTTQNVFRGNPAEAGFQPPQVSKGSYFNNGMNGEYTDTMTPLQRGIHTAGEYFDSASKWAKDNPYPAAGLAYYTAYKTGMLDQPKQEPIADNYKNPYTMTGFRRSSPSPSAYRYTPRYAEGGIASVHGYAKGGRSKAQSAMDFYDAMNPQQESAPLRHGDPGIYYDMDPDTRYLDPMEAAMVRMSKLNSRTNVQAPTMAPSRHMGELDFKPVAAAQGGIMGYAAGGDVPVEDDEFNRLTGRGGPSKYEDPNPSWTNATNAEKANWAREHPILAMPGQYLTSPTSTLGMALNFFRPAATAEANSIFRGIDPTPNAAGGTGDPTSGRDVGIGDGLGDVRVSFSPVQSPGEQGRGAPAPEGNSLSRDTSGESGGAGATGGLSTIHGFRHMAHGGIAGYNLGSYAAGGNPRLLRGPGDGMSDNIPATINHHQPARLADGEYVITADVVSHLGNGSTEAGAKQLDAMMKRVRKGRTGTTKQGKQIDPRKYLPA